MSIENLKGNTDDLNNNKAAMVIISNRDVKYKDNIEYSIFNNGVNARGNRIAFGWHYFIENKCKLKLQEYDTQAESLQRFVKEIDNDKPWVFFVHGNNQTYKKNLKKSKLIQKNYDVNMVLFSWPSRTYNVPSILVQSAFGIGKFIGIGKNKRRRFTNRLWNGKLKQYKTAQGMADDSVAEFCDAIDIFSDYISPEIHTRKTLLTHSLGNRLLKGLAEKRNFNNHGQIVDSLLVHQADVEANSHCDWLFQLNIVTYENIHITRNKHDAVLLLSDLANNSLEPLSRLGNHSDGITKDDRFEYMNYTGWKYWIEHELAWGKNTFNHLEIDINKIFGQKQF